MKRVRSKRPFNDPEKGSIDGNDVDRSRKGIVQKVVQRSQIWIVENDRKRSQEEIVGNDRSKTSSILNKDRWKRSFNDLKRDR